MEERLIQGVRCTVSNCENWVEQNRCRAGQILVTHGSPMLMADKHGADADQLEQTPAENIEATCCYTFEPEE
ncbi:MAG: DUF1540 domain-containing protein [Armatimonadota bacterium]|nr:DUF1540 domain-containing protein [Armatimonadota bacterium]